MDAFERQRWSSSQNSPHSASAQRMSQPRTLQKKFTYGGTSPISTLEAEEELTDHKVSQRQKQIEYGLITKGYRNMMRLVASDPRLRNGGVLPLEPPSTSMRASKRAWDVLARKWRRALHLFDDVYISGEDDNVMTLDDCIEEQRRKWVSPRFTGQPKANRQQLDRDAVFALRSSPLVPRKLPVEECMKVILKDLDCFEDMARVVPDGASSLTKGNTGVTPTDAGIKLFIAPSAESSLFNVLGLQQQHSALGKAVGGGSPSFCSGGRSPSPDMAVTPSTIAQMRCGATSPLMDGTSPTHHSGSNDSPSTSKSLTATVEKGSASYSSSKQQNKHACGTMLSADATPFVSQQRFPPTVTNFSPHVTVGGTPLPTGAEGARFTGITSNTVVRLENSFPMVVHPAVVRVGAPVAPALFSAPPPYSAQPGVFAPPPPMRVGKAPAALEANNFAQLR